MKLGVASLRARRRRGWAGALALLLAAVAMSGCPYGREDRRPLGPGPEGPLEEILHSHSDLQLVIEDAHAYRLQAVLGVV